MSYLINIFSSFWHACGNQFFTILSSPAAAAIIASLLAPYIGIKAFLSQQRASRIQKLFYEDTILGLIKHLDKASEITNQNLNKIENAFNFILDLHEKANPASTILRINNIVYEITVPMKYGTSMTEPLIKLFGRHGYILHQWLTKYDRDFFGINLYFRELVATFSNELEKNGRMQADIINKYRACVDEYYKFVSRHYSLIYLLNKIAIEMSILDFKSIKKLKISLNKNKEIKSYLFKIDGAYKTLFGYFKLDKGFFLSYLKDEDGYRYILDTNQAVSILRTKDIELPDINTLFVISDDLKLHNAKVNINGQPQFYSLIQLGMANYHAFDEKPKFYKQLESF